MEGHNLGASSRKAPRTVPPIRGQSTVIYVFETEGCTLNDHVLLTVYTIQINMYKVSSGSWVIAAPCKIKEEVYLLRSCDPLQD